MGRTLLENLMGSVVPMVAVVFADAPIPPAAKSR